MSKESPIVTPPPIVGGDFVLDCSIAMAWCFDDEATDHTRAMLADLGSQTAFVPGIWSLEVGNVLILAERKGRITRARCAEFVELLRELPIVTDDETSARGLVEILDLARDRSLTTYEAAYLELSMRRGVRLATKDKALRAAAPHLGVELLG